MRFLSLYLPALLFVGVCIVLVTWEAPLTFLTSLVNETGYVSYVMYTLLLIGAVVFMPVTVMPLIPMAAGVFGPFVTGVLSVIGWTIGGVIAFLVARYIGRPILTRFTNLDGVDGVIANIPSKMRFLYIVLLRLTLPVDLVSYALGFSKAIPLSEYALATLIGVTWFSFAFAYLGDAMLQKDVSLLISLGGISLVIFTTGWYLLRRTRQKQSNSQSSLNN